MSLLAKKQAQWAEERRAQEVNDRQNMFSAQVGSGDAKIEQARVRQAQMEYARGGAPGGGFQDHVEDSHYAESYDHQYYDEPVAQQPSPARAAASKAEEKRMQWARDQDQTSGYESSMFGKIGHGDPKLREVAAKHEQVQSRNVTYADAPSRPMSLTEKKQAQWAAERAQASGGYRP